MVWDINTKFLPVEDHNRRQLLTKFEGSWCAQIWISCQNILKLKWAWRAQFLSYDFQILQKYITLEDAQVILLLYLKILALNRICKKFKSLWVHLHDVHGLLYLLVILSPFMCNTVGILYFLFVCYTLHVVFGLTLSIDLQRRIILSKAKKSYLHLCNHETEL